MRKTMLFLFFLLTIGRFLFANANDFEQIISAKGESNVVGIYPNPIQTKGKLELTLTSPSEIRIEFFDMTGQLVKTIKSEYLEKGSHKIEFNAMELKNGVYLCKISTSEWVEAKRIIINH